MKLNLRIGAETEEIICPKDVVWIGVYFQSSCITMNISKYFDVLADNITVREEKRSLPDGSDITLLFYSSNDESYHRIIEKNKCLRILEFSYKEFELIVTA